MPLVNKQQLIDMKLEDDKLPSYAFPGGYPLFYVVADSGILCSDCANSEEYKKALEDYPEDKQWLIVEYDINYENAYLYCENCNNRIESAYNDLGDE